MLLFFFLHFYVFLFLRYFLSFTLSLFLLTLPFSSISFQHAFFPSSFPLPVSYSNVFGQSKLWKRFPIHRARLYSTPATIISTKHLSKGRLFFHFSSNLKVVWFWKMKFSSAILWDTYKIHILRNSLTFIQVIQCPKMKCAHWMNVCLEMAEGYKLSQSNKLLSKVNN